MHCLHQLQIVHRDLYQAVQRQMSEWSAQVLVQTAMFAAVGGLAYTIAEVLKLQGYIGYLLPMPIVLSAMHSGTNTARKTLIATFLLLLGESNLRVYPAKSLDCTSPLSASAQGLPQNDRFHGHQCTPVLRDLLHHAQIRH